MPYQLGLCVVHVQYCSKTGELHVEANLHRDGPHRSRRIAPTLRKDWESTSQRLTAIDLVPRGFHLALLLRSRCTAVVQGKI